MHLDPDSGLGLQSQVRQKLVDGAMSGAFPPDRRLPSSRRLAEQLGVARNTVVLACEQLIEEGLLESRERSGIFGRRAFFDGRAGFHGSPVAAGELDAAWRGRIRTPVGPRPRFQWPGDWQRHPFPSIDGHFDAPLYPIGQWREAGRRALGARIIGIAVVTLLGSLPAIVYPARLLSRPAP